MKMLAGNPLRPSYVSITWLLISLTPLALGFAAPTAYIDDRGHEKLTSALQVRLRIPEQTLQDRARAAKRLSGSANGEKRDKLWSLAWRADWQSHPEFSRFETKQRKGGARLVVTVPISVSLKLTKQTKLAKLVKLNGCQQLQTKVHASIDLDLGQKEPIHLSVRQTEVDRLTGRCSLDFLYWKLSDLLGQVRAAISDAVHGQDLAGKLNPLLKHATTLDPFRHYFHKWQRIEDAWVRADRLGMQLGSISSTGSALKIGFNIRMRPQIAFSKNPPPNNRTANVCPAAEDQFCLPLALLLPRTRVMPEAGAPISARESGYQLVPIAGRDMALLSYHQQGHKTDIVFLSGDQGQNEINNPTIPLQSEDVLTDAASWLADPSPWPKGRRPASLDPLFTQSKKLQTWLAAVKFDLGPAMWLNLHDTRLSMRGLRITPDELRALLHLTGQAEVEIDLSQL
ncbi:MAG: hypothetical protein QNJ78_10250 [Gammaproteobacteria bacterium]|nr:hypothetical protein [Gammaproteobacteria bacterium]